MEKKKSQNDRIYEYMKENGSITSLEAIYVIGCTRLSGRIHDLRRMGIGITSKTVVRKNRLGEDCHVSEYRLIDE